MHLLTVEPTEGHAASSSTITTTTTIHQKRWNNGSDYLCWCDEWALLMTGKRSSARRTCCPGIVVFLSLHASSTVVTLIDDILIIQLNLQLFNSS